MRHLKTRDIGQLDLGAVKLNLASVEALETLFGEQRAGVMTPAQAYAHNAFFRRAVDLRADSLSSIPFTITGAGSEWDTSENLRPPPSLAAYRHMGEFIRLSEVALVTGAQAYWLKERDSRGLSNLRWLAPGNVTPKFGPDGLMSVLHQVNNRRVIYEADDIVYLSQRSPYAEMGGADPVGQAAVPGASVLSGLLTWINGYIARGLIKAVVLLTRHRVPEAERVRFLDRWKRSYGGKRNAGAPILLNEAEGTLQEIGGTLDGVAGHDFFEYHIRSIAAGLGMSDTLLQSSAANRATRETDEEAFYTSTLMPQARRLAVQLEEQLFEPNRVRFQWHFDRLEAIQRMEARKAEKLVVLVDSGIMTIEEARSDLGLVDEVERAVRAVLKERASNGAASFR